MGRIPPAQLWQTSKATYILQMNKLRVQTLKMEKQPWILLHAYCSSLVAFCLLFTTNKWGQTPTPFFFWYERAPVLPTPAVCAVCCPPLPWLTFCPQLGPWSLPASLGSSLLGFFCLFPLYIVGLSLFFFFFLLWDTFLPASRVLEPGEKKQTSLSAGGACALLQNQNGNTWCNTQRGAGRGRQRERNCPSSNRSIGLRVFCIAVEVRKCPVALSTAPFAASHPSSSP